jgi:general stress protein 26
MPVWGVWMNDQFYFSTSARSQKAHNLALNPSCVIFIERADEAVVLEAAAEKVFDAAVVQQFEHAYRDKYGEDVNTDQFQVYAVRPRAAFGFISTAEAWAGSATRWRFVED